MTEGRLDRVRRTAHWLSSTVFVFSVSAFGAPGPPASRAPSAAKKPAETETLEIAADKLNLEIGRSTLLLEGNVRARLGDLELSCPHIEVRYDDAHRVRWARGFGGVRAKQRDAVATASSAEIDTGRRVVTLAGSVRLSQGASYITAERAQIDLRSRRISLSRVEGSIPIEAVQ
jgi:lipopolysaccharide export system protein LptA